MTNTRSIHHRYHQLLAPQVLDALVNKLDPKFKENPAFKQAVITFYNKYK
jgi:hypothetical protein